MYIKWFCYIRNFNDIHQCLIATIKCYDLCENKSRTKPKLLQNNIKTMLDKYYSGMYFELYIYSMDVDIVK